MPVPARAPRPSTLILLAALSVLPIGIFLPSINGIARTFEVDYGLISLALSAYAAMSAGLQLVMGPLSDRFGRRPVALASLALFIAASIGTALSTSAFAFLAFRLLQAVIASGYVIAMAVIRDTTDRQTTARRIGTLAVAWSLAPILGPSLGGLIDEAFGWRAVFWLLSGLGTLVLGLCWFDLGETNTRRDGSVWRQFQAYPVLLRLPVFWAYALCLAFSAGAFYAFLAGAPLAAQSAFAMSPAAIGLGLGSITVGFMTGSALSTRLAGRRSMITLLIAGRVVACTGLVLGLALAAAGTAHPASLFGPCMFVGIGNGLSIPSANAGAISVRPGMTGAAAGLAAAIGVAGGAALATVTSAVLTAQNARHGLLLVMLISAVLSLASADWARRLDARARRAAAG